MKGFIKGCAAILFFCVGVGFSACSKKYKRMSPSELSHALIGIYTADGIIEHFGAQLDDSLRQHYYDSLLAQNGFTYADFDSSITYYSGNNPTMWKHICEEVLDSIDKSLAYYTDMEERMRAKQLNLSAIKGYDVDSINLLGYNRPQSFLLGKALLDSVVSIMPQVPWHGDTKVEFAIHTLEVPKHYKLILGLRMTGLSDSIKFEKTQVISTGGLHTIRLKIPKDREVYHIKAFVKSENVASAKPAFLIIDSLSLVRFSPLAQDDAKSLKKK